MHTKKRLYKFVGIAIVIAIFLAGGFLLVRAASLLISETFNNPEKIASKTNVTICGGQVKLAESSWTTLTECNCNSLAGWYWYTTNGRSACWSKTLADSVSWNKGVGNDTSNPGAYTCATDVTALKDRMVAAAAGQWYKLVSVVNGVTITSAHNGSAGYSVISALAISDCLDQTRDLCTGAACLGGDLTAINLSLRTWSAATGNKSALPYCAGSNCDTSANNDWRNACEQNSIRDYPLACYSEALFYVNRKACGDGDTNYIWAAAANDATYARKLGYYSCVNVGNDHTSYTYSTLGFRAVLRP